MGAQGGYAADGGAYDAGGISSGPYAAIVVATGSRAVEIAELQGLASVSE